MNSHRTFDWKGEVTPSARGNRTVCSGKEWVYACSDESVYAASSSSSSGRGTSCGGSLFSSDGYLSATESCCDRDNDYYDKVGSDWERCLAAELGCCLGARPSVNTVVASDKCSQTRSGRTTSSLLYGVSALLAACILSSLAACIAVTSFSLTRVVHSREAAAAAAASNDRWTAWPLMPPPQAGGESPMQIRASTQREPARRYSLDCNAQPGHTKCRPVQKEQSRREITIFNNHQQYLQPPTTFRVFTNGVYHVSAQIAGTVWQPPPTLLRVVITRVTAESRTVNVTAAHAITGAVGSGDFAAGTTERGKFTVYTAVALRLSAGEELQAQVLCVEEPNCVTHVNGTTSYLTLEKLN